VATGDDQDRRIPPSRIERFDFAAISAEADEGPRPWTGEEIKRLNTARAIWREARDPRGTLAEEYLKTRALCLQDEVSGTLLRFHPACPWRNEDTGTVDRIPALLAAFRSIDNDGITSIHRIRLDQPECWPKVQRWMLGVMFRTAVKLDPVGETLYVGEGVETCLAGRVLGYKPAWALGSTGLISSFPIIDDVKQLIIFAETGEASARAIRFCSERWRKAGRVVRMVVPDDGCNDLNDELMAKTK
jgi:putative DNA primase/helicase